jgi:hypothetical protein
MKKEKVRNFNLIDMAVLVVLAALSVMFAKSGEFVEFLTFLSQAIRSSNFRWFTDMPSTLNFHLGSVLCYWTLGFLVLRMRRPRPRLGRLWRQPGFVATCAASTVILIILLEKFIWHRNNIMHYLEGDRLAYLFQPALGSSPQPGPAVAAAWTILILSGRWRPEASWVDRCGRLIGGLWVLLALVFPIFAWFH